MSVLLFEQFKWKIVSFKSSVSFSLNAFMLHFCTTFIDMLYLIFDASVYLGLSVLISIGGYGLAKSH